MNIQELIDELKKHLSKHGEMEVCIAQGKGHYPIVKLYIDNDPNDSPDDYLVIEPEPTFAEKLNG